MSKSKSQSNRRMKVRIMDEIDLEKEQEIVQEEVSEEATEEVLPLTQAMPTSVDEEELRKPYESDDAGNKNAEDA